MADLVHLTRGLALLLAWWVAWLSLLPYQPPQGGGDPFDAAVTLGWAQHFATFTTLGMLLAFAGCRGRRCLLWIIGGCAALELLQLAIPGRHPDARDFAFNTLGAVCGLLLAQRLRGPLAAWLDGRVHTVWRTLFVSGSIAAAVVAGTAQRGFDLANWDESYALLIGDELGGGRPWRGDIGDVALYPDALSESNARRLASRPRDRTLRDDLGAVAQFPFGQDLQPIDRLTPLQPAGAAATLCRALRATPAFSVEMRCAIRDLGQTGPARIVTFSHDTQLRNFTVGQVGDGIEFRVRCDVSGDNGLRYSGVWTGLFAKGRAAHLILTYNRGLMRLFVDGAPWGGDRSMFEQRAALHVASGGGALPLAILWFVPLGFALGKGWPQQRRHRRLLLAMVMTLLPAFAAAVLVPDAPEHPALTAAMGLAAVALVAGDAVGQKLSP